MRVMLAVVVLCFSMMASAAKIEIQHMSGFMRNEISKKNACAKAVEQLQRKITESCEELEGVITGDWKLQINHVGVPQKKCVVSGSGTCEVAL